MAFDDVTATIQTPFRVILGRPKTTKKMMLSTELTIMNCSWLKPVCVAVTGRKRTLFHCKWANLISYISRMLY